MGTDHSTPEFAGVGIPEVNSGVEWSVPIINRLVVMLDHREVRVWPGRSQKQESDRIMEV